MDTTTSSSSSDPGPVYFWRDTDPEVGYLSQWYYCPFRDDQGTKTYKTAEHYMMHQKALLFNDPDTAIQILKTASPRKVKSLGRQVKNFDEETWLKHRCAVARRGNMLKFTRAITEEGFKKGTPSGNVAADKLIRPIEGSLKDMLLSTGDRDLVEASPFDRIWGIGFRAADAEMARDAWGENLLGDAPLFAFLPIS
ncbi:hypothetical protein FHETE_10708 [Fusarium heterosporum]|uniref:NADAR domain-containing protein n=1 Tax=Fusarium heterosporum TaxID=42747 RepID=A0A8H5WEE9_FUSHE|nr:hypothetical protein FHETE_10708 [Fusarium heterosporum]